MQQDNLTINLTVPTGWDKLDDHQLRYVFSLLAQGFAILQGTKAIFGKLRETEKTGLFLWKLDNLCLILH